MTESKLPQVIILYGPPAAGKGTQANILKKSLPDYYHLDFGTEIRKFVADNKNSTDQDLAKRAKRVEADMSVGPITTEDLRFIVEKAIVDNIQKGSGMIIEGPGRLVEEAKWLSAFFAQNSAEVAIFHLHLDLEEVVHRSTNRYYIPSSKTSFKSYQEAKKAAQQGEEPYQRKEDQETKDIVQRYNNLYAQQWAKIISIYQLQAKALILTLDASQNIDQVTKDIQNYLQSWFNFEI